MFSKQKQVLNKQRPRWKTADSYARAKMRCKRIKAVIRESEIRYRRLFETARDGILILDARAGSITDVNPFLVRLLGRPRENLLGKKFWEIGLFQDVEKSKKAFSQLQRDGYIRYEDLPLETKDGRCVDVEFVSNVYRANGVRVIQCNIRDITQRKRAEVEKAILQTVEEEQRRIGQDLHDGLCQQLTGISLIAKALAQKLSSETNGASADAAEIVELISRSIDQTRDLARGLSPIELEIDGLKPALQKYAATIERFYNVSCVFNYEESDGPGSGYSTLLSHQLYRIAQEAVNNAVQRGKAKRVVVTLADVRDRGLLTIQDDGAGFEIEADEKPGLGLRNMQYRGRMIGARFKICHDASGGTLVTCSFPHQHETDASKP